MIAAAERERFPEVGNLLRVDPSDLMRDNPAALIVNRESYERMKAHFAFDKFDPPQVVWVTTYSSEQHKEVKKLFVVDGLTRTKYVNDHRNQAFESPSFDFSSIPVRDVTVSELKNPRIVPQSRGSNQKALSMEQYLRIVVPPTIVHSEIAPDRIAAHIINAWQNIVGGDISERFSGTAALTLIANETIPTATDHLFRKSLEKQPVLIVGETKEERDRVQKALRTMASIIRESKLVEQHVARAAFTLVGSASEVIGGELEAGRQIYGMLHTDKVDRKLMRERLQPLEAEEKRRELGEVMLASFRRFSRDYRQGQVVLESLTRVLHDSDLNLQQTFNIFKSSSPGEEHVRFREEINRNRLEKKYQDEMGRSNLTDVEISLIDNIGRETHPPTLIGLISHAHAIRSAQNVLNQAKGWETKLFNDSDDFLRRGANRETVREAIKALQIKQDDLLSSDSATILKTRTRALLDFVGEVDRRVATQILTHQVGRIVDQAYGDELREGYGPTIRSQMINQIIHDGDFNATNDREVKQWIRNFTSLDSDLQNGVLRNDMKLSLAVRRQADRQKQPVEQVVRRVSSDQGVTRPSQNVVDFTQDRVDRTRQEAGNQQLVEIVSRLDQILDELKEVDINPHEINPSHRRVLGNLVSEITKLLYGISISPENYSKLRQDNTNLHQRIVEMRQELMRDR